MTMEDLTERLTALSIYLEAALDLTISTLESKINAFESLVQTTQQAPPVVEAPLLSAPTSAQPETESLTDIPAKWEKTDDAQWSSVREERATERERLSSTREEWTLKVKATPPLSPTRALQRWRHSSANRAPRRVWAHRRQRAHGVSRRTRNSAEPKKSILTDHDIAENAPPRTQASVLALARANDWELFRQESTDFEHRKDDTAAVKQFETPESSVHEALMADSTQTAVGVLVLGVATAIVLWRVKLEE
ncbi:hypothetical protein FIBSPDRAFT_967996 [Athelia psychrophila]|uniref:Uncharacterized protein n=1 Tax=Athelia psychrophila TaxID=1759441 RepID=A0A167V3G7_9AGAM|nr:hypothetical protein FIBSPDRAFT_967996 [Fibularhizoctonia sp. CBS 109695]